METEELTKLVDGIYKNILEKFNPGARQMITAGKAYLKALHGTAAASRIYVDAISKLGRQAQQGTWGCSADIGTALMKVVEVYKEIQDQQMNILKAFYVDLLVPLETNLEKDTKVVQSEQKRFMQQHKARTESYSKAIAASKKQRKRNTRNAAKAASEVDKELKSLQILEEEKNKLTAFCEHSLKNAMTQERRRYGFVLERQCSLAGHWLAAHAAAAAGHRSAAAVCRRAAASRETLPASVHDMFTNKIGQHVSMYHDDEDVYANPAEARRSGSAIRKARSVEASSADVRDLDEPTLALERAKSDFSLHANMHNLDDEMKPTTTRRPKSFAAPTQALHREVPIARAIYPYHSSGENQLSFLEGDTLVLLGDRTKGWQYGENLRTQMAGWFPLAYTEVLVDESMVSPSNLMTTLANSTPSFDVDMVEEEASVDVTPDQQQTSHMVPLGGEEGKTARMFGDTLQGRKSSNHIRRLTNTSQRHHGPPPTLPAPVPSPSVPNSKKIPHSQSSNFQPNSAGNQHISGHMKSSGSNNNYISNHDGKPFIPQTLPVRGQVRSNKNTSKAAPIGNMSLHSSNDSGFSNEPPPQPDIDYSDEELMMSNRNRIPIRSDQQNHSDDKIRTQSLMRSKSKDSSNTLMQSRISYMEGDLHMLTMDKESHGIKRTKSFWKFGRTTQDDIMVGMSLWQHRDLVDTVPVYKQKETREKVEDVSINNNKNNSNNQTTLSSHKVPASPPQPNGQVRRQISQTIDRKEILRNVDSTRQSLKIVPVEQNINTNKNLHNTPPINKSAEQLPQTNKNYRQSYSPPEEEYNTKSPDAQSNHSDFTNGSTIKTNFENSFYDDENGEGLIVKTVKRKEILQRYDNNDVSDENSNSSSTDPYDCIIVDDHLKSNKNNKVSSSQQRSPKIKNDPDSGRKHQKNNTSNLEEDLPRTHVRTKLFADRKHNGKNERNNVIEEKPPQKLETFKTFKDNENDIKMLSESSETLKYKDYEQNDDQYYYESQTMMIRREDNPRQIEKGSKYVKNNNVDADLTKYSKHTNYNDRYYRNQENDDFNYNDQSLRSNGHYDPRQNNHHARNEEVMNEDINYRENNFTGRYSDHREDKSFSNQDTDSRKAAKTKKYNKQEEQSMRHSYEEQTLRRKSSGHKYGPTIRNCQTTKDFDKRQIGAYV